MTFGYNDEIFKYPAVQYIPLQIINLKQGNCSQKLSTRFYIYLANDNIELNDRIKRFGIESPYIIEEGKLAVFVINGVVELVKYRGYEVIMVGRKEKMICSLFKLSTEYFYKNRIFFSFYDGITAEKIDREFINEKKRW